VRCERLTGDKGDRGDRHPPSAIRHPQKPKASARVAIRPLPSFNRQGRSSEAKEVGENAEPFRHSGV
jgi:hypothetical protein